MAKRTLNPMAPRKFLRNCGLGMLMILLAAGNPALAAEQQSESEVPEREVSAALEAVRAAETAEEQRVADTKKEVTFEDILKDPDNIKLNYLYAKSQLKKGNVRHAASTLERILMVDPSRAKVRALYGIVLYRLDDMVEAERELMTASQVDLPPKLKSEVDRYLEKVKRRKRSIRFGLRESVGFQIETNRNAAPSSKKRLVNDTLADLAPNEVKQDDTSLLNITGLDVTRDLGFQAGHELIGSFTYFLGEQTEVDSLDLESYRGDLGLRLKSRYLNVTPAFVVTHTSLSRETFLRTQGGGLLVESPVTDRIRLFGLGRLTRQGFADISENLLVDERDGYQKDGTLGVSYALTAAMSVSARYGHIDKNARVPFKAYNGNNVLIGHSWLLGKVQFLLNSVEYQHDDYEGPDFSIAPVHRRDKVLRVRSVYGAPLSFLLDRPVYLITGKEILPSPFRNVVFTFTFEYLRSLSNLPNFTYRNSKFGIMLSKKFEF